MPRSPVSAVPEANDTEEPPNNGCYVEPRCRVCRHDALVTIMVPHVRSDAFLADPTHVRPIMAEGLALFDQRANRHWLEKQQSNTPLGLMLGVDFRIEAVDLLLSEPWIAKLKSGEITESDIDDAARTYGNVVDEVTIRWRVVKPGAGGR